ncbi:MAG: ABC transporter substrate-binding protein [Gemmatimonadota bacterium]|jgi:peptide/nickel transport system substrate-binding protein
MRKVLVLGMASVAAACGGGEGGTPVASSDPFCQQVMPAVQAFMEQARAEHPVPDDPRYGGTVVVGAIGELSDGMNAAVSTDYAATQHQQFLNLMPLVVYDENQELQPNLAESFEVSEDGTSVTFHLRDDVYWHDGVLTDANDVRFTYEVVTDPLTAFPNAAFWDYFVKGPDGVEVLDDFTVRIHMQPHSEPLDPFWSLGILPEHLLGDVPRDQLRIHPFGTQCPVGNGPFVFAEHRSQQRWVFEANPAFPAELGGRPYVDRYVYRSIPEQTTLLTELLTENVDVYIRPTPDQAQDIIDNPDVRLLDFTFRNYVAVIWNSRRPQLADPRVRRAITMGTNRQQIVDALLEGYGRVANSTVPPFHWAFDPEVNDEVGLHYDPEAARALLDQAGWIDRDGDGVRESADGTPLSFSIKYNDGNQTRQDITEIMQAQLAQIGIDAQPQVVEWVTLLSQINDPAMRDFDGVVMGWVNEFRLDDTDLFDSDRIDQPYAWSGTQNPEIDRLVEELGVTMDRDRAKELWTEYQRVLAEEQPYTFFYFDDRLEGVNNRLQGVVMDARGEWVSVKDWYIDPASR